MYQSSIIVFHGKFTVLWTINQILVFSNKTDARQGTWKLVKVDEYVHIFIILSGEFYLSTKAVDSVDE